MALGVAGQAAADEWPQLADGRRVIEVKGEKFAMPADAPSLLGITFSLRQQGKPGALTLKEVLAKPDEARAAFNRASSVRIDIPNIADRKDRWLGEFDREAVKLNAVSIESGEGVAEDCVADAKSLNGFRARAASGEGTAGEDGWTEFVSEQAPRDYTYVKALRASAMPDHFDSIRCNYHEACLAKACVKPNAAFTYRFNRKFHPRAEWNEVVARAGGVMRYLVPAAR
jgi:hypothetical protein